MWKKAALAVIAAVFAASVGCTGGDDDDDDDDGSSNGTAVTGTVFAVAGGPLEGATIAEVGTNNDTTSAADGSYTLYLASNAEAVIRRTATDYPPFQMGLFVPPGGAVVNLGGPDNAQVTGVAAILGVTIDPADGIIIANFSGAGVETTGGFMASISATNEGSFVFGGGGAPTAGDTTIANQDAQVIFYNVTEGTTTVTVTPPPGWSCAPQTGVTNHRVDAGTFTVAPFFCQ